MLVHHADVEGRGVVGVVDLHDLAVFLDDACFRLIKSEQNAHQRGFARAVFSQQSVNLSPAELESDIVIGDNAGEFFPDVEHFNNVIGLHYEAPSFPT